MKKSITVSTTLPIETLAWMNNFLQSNGIVPTSTADLLRTTLTMTLTAKFGAAWPHTVPSQADLDTINAMTTQRHRRLTKTGPLRPVEPSPVQPMNTQRPSALPQAKHADPEISSKASLIISRLHELPEQDTVKVNMIFQHLVSGNVTLEENLQSTDPDIKRLSEWIAATIAEEEKE